jgi:hypothetical protein
MTLQESKIQVDELCVELSLAHSSSSAIETQLFMATRTHLMQRKLEKQNTHNTNYFCSSKSVLHSKYLQNPQELP